MKRIPGILAVLLCISCLLIPAKAADIVCGSIYCFQEEDFSPAEGIVLTRLPESKVGTLQLGSRVLRAGDVLTAAQAAQMTFCPTPASQTVHTEVGYRTIGNGKAEPETIKQLSILGREDQPPIAEDSALETYRNLEINGQLKVRDPESQPLTFSVSRPPRRGTVTIQEGGSFTYTPKKNKVGVDSFTYTAADPAGKISREATVTVTILKPSDAPQYADTAGMDCRFAAEWMKNTGIFVGETLDGKPCFSPDKAVTQGEFLTMLVKTLDIPTDSHVSWTGNPNTPKWLQPYLAAALRSGFWIPSETFLPDAPMERTMASALIGNAADWEDVEVFSETSAILTRAEAAEMLYRLAQYRTSMEKAGLPY